MCVRCDNPDMTDADFDAMVARIVEANGWAVQSVGDNHHVAFAYTIGLTLRGWPELIMHNTKPRRAQTVLNAVAQTLVDNPDAASAFHRLEPVPFLIDGEPCLITPRVESNRYLVIARKMYMHTGTPVRGLAFDDPEPATGLQAPATETGA